MEVTCTDHVKNGEELLRLKEETNIEHITEGRNIIWIGLILRRNCLLQHVTKERTKSNDRSEGKTSKKT